MSTTARIVLTTKLEAAVDEGNLPPKVPKLLHFPRLFGISVVQKFLRHQENCVSDNAHVAAKMLVWAEGPVSQPGQNREEDTERRFGETSWPRFCVSIFPAGVSVRLTSQISRRV